MRYLLLVITAMLVLGGYSQPIRKIQLFGIVVSPDSVPIPDVAIINMWSGKVVRTDAKGFFHTMIITDDSLLVYHIAYKKQFINKNNLGKFIILQPEIQQLMQVNVINKREQEQKNLEQTINEIRRLAPAKKLEGYDYESSLDYFVLGNGAHGKGFKPFFGPTILIPTGKIAEPVTRIVEKNKQKKRTTPIHLLKEQENQ